MLCKGECLTNLLDCVLKSKGMFLFMRPPFYNRYQNDEQQWFDYKTPTWLQTLLFLIVMVLFSTLEHNNMGEAHCLT